MRRPAKKGDPLLAHLTSDTFNELIRSVQQPTTPLPRKPHDDNTLVKAVYAGEDEAGLLLFEPVVIIGQRLTVATTLPDTSMMDMVLEVVKMSEATTEGDEELPAAPVPLDGSGGVLLNPSPTNNVRLTFRGYRNLPFSVLPLT